MDIFSKHQVSRNHVLQSTMAIPRLTQRSLHGEQSFEQIATSLNQIRFHQRSEVVNAAFVENAVILFKRVLSMAKAPHNVIGGNAHGLPPGRN